MTNQKIMQNMRANIPYILDSWSDPVVHFIELHGLLFEITTSVTRLGQFLYALDNEFSYQRRTNILWHFVFLKKHHSSKLKSPVANFWATFGKIWVTLYYNNWLRWSQCTLIQIVKLLQGSSVTSKGPDANLIYNLLWIHVGRNLPFDYVKSRFQMYNLPIILH